MREGGRGTGLPFPVSPPTVTVALRLDYQANPLCWVMLEALRELLQVLHRSSDFRMLLASNTVTVEALKARHLETELSLPCYQKGLSRLSLWASVSLPMKGK